MSPKRIPSPTPPPKKPQLPAELFEKIPDSLETKQMKQVNSNLRSELLGLIDQMETQMVRIT